MTEETPTQQDEAAAPPLEDLSTLRREDFDPFVGQDFKSPLTDGSEIGMELVEVKDTISDARFGERQGFVLTFKGPMEPYFKQGSIRLDSPDGRSMVLFAVNNGPRDGGHFYQIVLA